ncbi:MAG: dimethyl sulfoxide reductase anchor subunit [Gammaproteobacteria bacterium]|nr:dimethyl sulfoxide reductase anchor subunit [Gammaproteobacteria bacterium]MDH5799907.1 dimethyl sulfoxide reductase anchor subunit [Gammaproteobacteria bacterium]
MNPPFSVVFLTTLIGVGQGLFLALVLGQSYSIMSGLPPQNGEFYSGGALLAMIFLIAGLFASFFHLGHPERAWRAAAQWRTSWLSREVIALPLFMLLVFVYGVLHYFNINPATFGTATIPEVRLTVLIGIAGLVVCFALYVCTGMIYACLKFLQEWHSPLTVINYTLLGMASGYTLCTVYASRNNSQLVDYYADWAIILTLLALVTRGASLLRNRRLKAKSSLKSAIGVRHINIQQKAMGAMGGTFNTREFFHGKTALFLKSVKWIFLIMVFPLPVLFLSIGLSSHNTGLYVTAFIVQYLGLLVERWFFFAQANHPQNMYYQTV